MANHKRKTVNGMQACSQCNTLKPLSDFSQSNKYANGYCPVCKACEASRMRKKYGTEEYRQKHRIWVSSYRKTDKGFEVLQDADLRKHYRGKYGISLEEYDALVEKQNGVCAICGKLPEKQMVMCKKDVRPYVLQRLLVDHDHKSGKIRGLLCRKCNLGLGYFEDSTKSLINAIRYLL